MPAGISDTITDTITELESKELPNGKTKPPITENTSLSPKMRWMNNSKLRV